MRVAEIDATRVVRVRMRGAGMQSPVNWSGGADDGRYGAHTVSAVVDV